jgi:hypothetical protein
MSILEIKLKNPIGFNEIDQFRSDLMEAEHFDFLIIDTGVHDFEAIEVIKYFRDQFDGLKERLSKFKKIAFMRPSQYVNKSSNPKVYDFFDSKIEAEKWFLE